MGRSEVLTVTALDKSQGAVFGHQEVSLLVAREHK